MNDAFLKFVWQYLRFDERNLCTQTGQKIEVISPGIPNEESGPDFINATIRIGSDLWKGGIVVHFDGEEWYAQHCNSSHDYSNVILNVSFRNVRPISDMVGRRIPSLELNGKISKELIQYHSELKASRSVLACKDHLVDIDKLTLFALRERLITERLELRSIEIYKMLDDLNWDWDKAFLKFLVKSFGRGMASIKFTKLAEVLNYDLLVGNRMSAFTIEALIFGQAGMLERTFVDSYPKMLKELFDDFRMAYDLETMHIDEWNCKNCETSSYVPLRIAKLAYLINQDQSCFHKFVDHNEPWKLFDGLRHSFYWNDHCAFEQPGTVEILSSSKELIHSLMIDVFTPAVYAYGKSMAVPDICLHAIEILNELEPEVNRKTKLFSSIGLSSSSAADSQAITHIMNCYCINKQCLNCPVGRQIMGGVHEEVYALTGTDCEYHYN